MRTLFAEIYAQFFRVAVQQYRSDVFYLCGAFDKSEPSNQFAVFYYILRTGKNNGGGYDTKKTNGNQKGVLENFPRTVYAKFYNLPYRRKTACKAKQKYSDTNAEYRF